MIHNTGLLLTGCPDAKEDPRLHWQLHAVAILVALCAAAPGSFSDNANFVEGGHVHAFDGKTKRPASQAADLTETIFDHRQGLRGDRI